MKLEKENLTASAVFSFKKKIAFSLIGIGFLIFLGAFLQIKNVISTTSPIGAALLAGVVGGIIYIRMARSLISDWKCPDCDQLFFGKIYGSQTIVVTNIWTSKCRHCSKSLKS